MMEKISIILFFRCYREKFIKFHFIQSILKNIIKNSVKLNFWKIPEKLMPKRMFKDLSKYVGNDSLSVSSLSDGPEFGFFSIFRTVREQDLKFKVHFTPRSLPQVIGCLKGIKKSFKTLKNNPFEQKDTMSIEELSELEEYARSIGVKKIGYTEVLPQYIFRDQKQVLFKNVIVIIDEMDYDKMGKAPSATTMVMIHKTYRRMGIQANKLANFLRKKDYAAHAGPALGGLSIYPILAQDAGLGIIGRHGLLINPEFGPRHRIAVVYTNIQNLPVSNENAHKKIQNVCGACGRCIEKCPTGAIHETPIIGLNGRMTHVDIMKCWEGFINYGCSICIKECPLNKAPKKL